MYEKVGERFATETHLHKVDRKQSSLPIKCSLQPILIHSACEGKHISLRKG